MIFPEPPLFIKPSNPKGDVLIFGKGEDIQSEDSKNGVSRFGGTWRAPDYLFAYLKAAAILIEHGLNQSALDDIGLPTFYMQRHATELLIKRLLSWIYEFADFRSELGVDCGGMPSKGKRVRLKKAHNLGQLLDDLKLTSQHFGFSSPPTELTDLVTIISEFEETETWARYGHSESKDGAVINHVKDEIAVPIVDIQHRLELVTSKVSYQMGEETYENELYEGWLNAARAVGKAG